MKNVSALPSDALLRLQQVGPVDLIVGVPSYNNEATIGHVVRTAADGILQYFPDLKPLIVNSDGGSADNTRQVAVDVHVPNAVPVLSFVYQGIPGKGTALKAVFEAVEQSGARACVLLDSDLRSVTPEWVHLLAAPVLSDGYDYVAPLYIRHKYDGTITNNLAYPLTRALYGLSIRQPIGGDFGLSRDLASRYLSKDVWESDVARFGIDIFMTTVAINEGFKICQSELGVKIHDVKDPAASLGPMFVQVLGTLFALMGTYQERWQHVQGSMPTPAFGSKKDIEPEPVAVTVGAMIEKFKAGAHTFEDLWSRILDVGNHRRIMEAADLNNEFFRFPVDLWARTVYDFAAAYYHVDQIGLKRDDVIAALTPLYYGRTASVVIEASDLDSSEFERLIEAQAQVFEAEKPYLARRWKV